MVLSDENIKEFQRLHKQHFGTEISTKDAQENAAKLLRLIDLLYRPSSQEKNETVEEFHKTNRPNDEN
jgi:hypothetical protein